MSGTYIGQSTVGVLPNITGSFGFSGEYRNIGFSVYSGAFAVATTAYGRDADGGGTSRNAVLDFSASRSSTIYGNGWYDGAKVVPAGTGVNYIIKY